MESARARYSGLTKVDTSPSISRPSLLSLAMISELTTTNTSTTTLDEDSNTPTMRSVMFKLDNPTVHPHKTHICRKTRATSVHESGSPDELIQPLQRTDSSFKSSLSERARRTSVCTLEDEVTRDKLTLLADIFAEAAAKTGGKLDMKRFKRVMRQTGSMMSDEQLEMAFMKVDTNCDLTVEWDEYVSFMLLECLEKDQMNAAQLAPFPDKARRIQSDHRFNVVRILLLPQILISRNQQKIHQVVNPIGGTYVAVDGFGTVTFWSISVAHKRTREVHPNTVIHRSELFITDMTSVHAGQLLVFSTSDCELQFFDIVITKFKRICRITNLPHCPVTLYFYESTFSDKQRLIWGDIKGGIGTIVFTQPPRTIIINAKMCQGRILHFCDIVHGSVDGMQGHYAACVHCKMVRQIRYAELLSSVISVARSGDKTMCIGNFEKKMTLSYFDVYRGINSVDYCSRTNTVVTGGQDAVVRIWNPYVTAKPVSLLYGHESPIQQVHINSAHMWVVSIGKNLEVRVHDLTTQVCVQTIHRRAFPDHTGPFSATFLSPYRQALLLASHSIFVLEHQDEEKTSRGILAHTGPVRAVKYNQLFRQVVSACAASVVCVWSLPSGKKVMQFRAATNNYDDAKSELTAMCFDPTLRRLITGSDNGFIAIWNFNNGACLQTFPRQGNTEITCLETGWSRIFAGGWSRTVVAYIDDVNSEKASLEFHPMHDNDVLSMTACPPDMIASGSQDGAIFLWSHSSRKLAFAINTPKMTPFGMSDYQTNPQNDNSTAYISDSEKDSNGSFASIDVEDQQPHKTTSLNIRECCRPVFSTPIEKLLFLPSREGTHGTASLLAAGSDGFVRAWCICAPGCYIGGFAASHNPDEPVPAMVINKTNDLLVTGDASGYMKVWDISHFAVRGRHCCKAEHRKRSEVWKEFRLRQWLKRLEQIGQLHKAFPSMRTAHARDEPHLLTSVHAHLACINFVDCFLADSGDSIVLTGSDDHSVRMWSLHGQFLGLFGQPLLWDFDRTYCLQSEQEQYKRYRPRGYLMPPDVRRCASSTTLHTLNNFVKTTWRGLTCIQKCARNFMDAGHRYREAGGTGSVRTSDLSELQELPCPLLGRDFRRLTRHLSAKIARPVIFGNLCPAFHSIPLPTVDYVDFTLYTSMLKVVRDRYQFSQHVRLPSIRTGTTQRPMTNHGHVVIHGHSGDNAERIRARICGHAGDHDHAGTRRHTDDHNCAGAHGDTVSFGNAGDNAQGHR